MNYDASNMSYHFRVCSAKFIYSLSVFLVILALGIVSLRKAMYDRLEFDKIVTAIFYLVDAVAILQFQCVAKQWNNIMVVWQEFERQLDPNEQHLGKRYSLKVLFKLIIIGVTLASVVAEILAVVAGIENGQRCVSLDGDLHRFFKQEFPQVFHIVEYSVWKGILMQILQFFCTFIRMFLDVFLALISIGLCRLIARLNLQFGLRKRDLSMTVDFWTKYKSQYLHFVDLVQFVDKSIGNVIVLCFLSDLYLICIRILNSLRSMDTIRQALFFWYVLLFLIVRFIWVCIAASMIHEEAKRPLELMRKVSAVSWSVEAQRFQDLVTHNDVCLTGIGYFKLRRTLLLAISGTIVTYELVLMQFNDSGSLDSSNTNPCT